MKIKHGYIVKMIFYEDNSVSWEIFEGEELINFGTSWDERKARRLINATFKSLNK